MAEKKLLIIPILRYGCLIELNECSFDFVTIMSIYKILRKSVTSSLNVCRSSGSILSVCVCSIVCISSIVGK